MIRRDFMKLISIAAMGLAAFGFPRPNSVVAQPAPKQRRQWLSGSTRSGCAQIPAPDTLIQ